MGVHIYKSKELLAEGLAGWIVGNMAHVLRVQKRYSFVLSGGHTPKQLYHILSAKYKRAVDWSRVDFFWGDERYVPITDDRNNARMAYECLLTPLGIPSENVFVMPTDPTPQEAALQYEATLKKYFGESPARFDLVLLGMGADGHTLSLFPGSDLIDYTGQEWVKDTVNQKEHLPRITLMPSLVNASENVLFCISGTEKAEPAYQVLKGSYNPSVYPSQLIRPAGGAMWFMDMDAAGKL